MGEKHMGKLERAPDLDVKLKAFVDSTKTDAVDFFLQEPWSVQYGLKGNNARLGCDLMREVLGFVRGGRCRMLDYGAGEARLFDDIKAELSRIDRREGSKLLKRFRGIAVDLTDYRMIRAYEEWLHKSRGIIPERGEVMYYGPGQYEKRVTRSYLDYKKGFERFKAEALSKNTSLGRHGGCIVGDIRDSLQLGPNHPRVQMVVSVGTLHFIPDALKIVKDVYNNRLAIGGKAYLEIDDPEYLEIQTPNDSITTLEDVMKQVQVKQKHGIKVKQVESYGSPTIVIEMEKTTPEIKIPLELVDLRPCSHGRRQPTNVVKVYKVTEETPQLKKTTL